ncbi:HNH endonuclease [Halolamina salina]|uniref:HNH endonuclease n=1 Tax=Halolamina salina TaxID=1220023 RepID=A0ABD6B346_9EURY
MPDSSTTDGREQAKRLAQLAETDPASAVTHLPDLPPLLVADDVETRVDATRVLVPLSIDYPEQLRSISDAILARLDDEHTLVRQNILLTISNLATWFPQDFGDGTDLMVESLNADQFDERVAAGSALSKIAYYRPDLVTPREEAKEYLEMRIAVENIDEVEMSHGDSEIFDGAIQALEGGDMPSRVLEDDLAPTGLRTKISKPARAALTGLLWVPLAIASVFFWVYRALKYFRWLGVNKYTSVGRLIALTLRTAYGHLKHVTLLTPIQRAQLYVRRSPIATPTGLLPWFVGRTPTKVDRTTQTPPLPDNWGAIARSVRQRDGYECRNCGALGGPRGGSAELHVDHAMPRSRGGADHPKNLRTLCRGCHEARHGRKFSNQ